MVRTPVKDTFQVRNEYLASPANAPGEQGVPVRYVAERCAFDGPTGRVVAESVF